MSLTFLLLLPLGSLLPRTLSHLTPHAIPLHRALQLTGFLVVLVALAMGVWVCAGLGQIHHTLYLRSRPNTLITLIHRFLGPTTILLGIINGGLGLRKADAGNGARAGYAVVGVVIAVGVGVVVVWARRSRGGREREGKRERERERGWELGRR
ncbi:hypothetical protein EX30DRAFT_351831 [Ascodesmis nigricans]|uniref:Cytochrome b561 domain-containing protein n=1 Tax=Ascodesmis nigricans TaxID=341454 RepID=A0A4S2MRE5_9PEZI|nr:hypothetical protein EX30DRAFT_351831 [Ascodesmis nigricans]